ncbi:hypothetical protein [Spiroplasma kunkelii]|uniref:hypothetical protein n=1 Tax=Spiroplasma kunkelii TaxID=47834 RepID=UPI0003253534|nr:hypothetical protein [Spiroplasma kunkelii]
MRKQIIKTLISLNDQEYCGLGIGYKVVNENPKVYNINNEKDLIFYGYATFLDISKPLPSKIVKVLATLGV